MPQSWTWRQITFWCVLGLLVAAALALGYGRWVFEAVDVLKSFRVITQERADSERLWINTTPLNSEKDRVGQVPEVQDHPAQVVEQKQPPVRSTLHQSERPTRKEATPLAKSNELETQAALERLLKTRFVKIRPDWLKNPRSGRRLECDAYSVKHRLCVETQGQQHYVFVPFFHKTTEGFHAQLYRDKIKQTQLKEHGDTLLTVPYWVPRENIEEYLRNELLRHGFKLA